MANNKREYPLFLIDRTKSPSHPFDYVSCFDKRFGWVARVVHWEKTEVFEAFLQESQKISNYASYSVPLRIGGVSLIIEDYLYYFELDNEAMSRITGLLKKAMKKYLHQELDRTPKDDLSIDNQIKQQKLTIERARQTYDDLLERAGGDPELVNYQLALAEATLKTLENYKDNMDYFRINMN